MSKPIGFNRVRTVIQHRIDACERAVAHYQRRHQETGDEAYARMAASERCAVMELRHVHDLLTGDRGL